MCIRDRSFDSVRDADSDLGLARFCWPGWRQQLLRLAISAAPLRLALEILALAALLRRATSSANILSSQLSSIAVAGQRPLLGLELGHLGTGPCSNQGVPWPWISWSVLGTDPCLNREAKAGHLAGAAA